MSSGKLQSGLLDAAGGLSGLSIGHMLLFYHLCRTGSISRTAEKLSISQPAVSMKLRQLEKQLGKDLWVRRGKNSGQITEAGRKFEEFSRRVLEEAGRLMESVSGVVSNPLIRICASTIPGEHLIPGLLASFAKVNPGIRTDIKILDSLAVLKAVAEGEADVGFSGWKKARSGLRFSSIDSDRLLFVVSPDHPFALRKTPLQIEDIFTEVLIVRERGSGTGAVVEAALKAQGLSIPDYVQVIAVGSSQSVCSAIRAGLGVGFISHRIQGGLVPVPISGFTPIQRNLYLVYSVRKRLSQESVSFIAFAQDYFRFRKQSS